MYTRRITRIHRTAIVVAVDCSTSMQCPTKINNLVMTKAEAIAFACNFLIDELLALATRHDGVRNYYDVAILGYSGDGVESLLPNEGFHSITHLANIAPATRDYHFDSIIPTGEHCTASYAIRSWIEPKATGNTPMFEALSEVSRLVEEWCSEEHNRESFPPIVFNISDGEPTDASHYEMISVAERIKASGTRNGNTLLFNLHLGSDIANKAITFPREYDFASECRHQNMLFRMSSILPNNLESLVKEQRIEQGPYRCVAFNATFSEVMAMLNIGSESISRH